MLDRVVGIAAEVGLDYDYDHSTRPTRCWRTSCCTSRRRTASRPSSRSGCCAAYFVEGRHVGRAEELADLAADVGLDRDEALAALADHRYLAAVKADMAQAVAYGITRRAVLRRRRQVRRLRRAGRGGVRAGAHPGRAGARWHDRAGHSRRRRS